MDDDTKERTSGEWFSSLRKSLSNFVGGRKALPEANDTSMKVLYFPSKEELKKKRADTVQVSFLAPRKPSHLAPLEERIAYFEYTVDPKTGYGKMVFDERGAVSARRFRNKGDSRENPTGGIVEEYRVDTFFKGGIGPHFSENSNADIYIAPNALVYGNPVIGDGVRIEDYAQVFGYAYVGKKVFSQTHVETPAIIRGYAKVHGEAEISTGVTIEGEVKDASQIDGKNYTTSVGPNFVVSDSYIGPNVHLYYPSDEMITVAGKMVKHFSDIQSLNRCSAFDTAPVLYGSRLTSEKRRLIEASLTVILHHPRRQELWERLEEIANKEANSEFRIAAQNKILEDINIKIDTQKELPGHPDEINYNATMLLQLKKQYVRHFNLINIKAAPFRRRGHSDPPRPGHLQVVRTQRTR